MSKTQMEMRDTLRRAGEGDKKLEDANFGILYFFMQIGYKNFPYDSAVRNFSKIIIFYYSVLRLEKYQLWRRKKPILGFHDASTNKDKRCST